VGDFGRGLSVLAGAAAQAKPATAWIGALNTAAAAL